MISPENAELSTMVDVQAAFQKVEEDGKSRTMCIARRVAHILLRLEREAV